ncbi:MAG: hypothetical protein ACK6CT_12705 [Planctomycetia bacterium]|jgi:hypothetical protein
MVQSSAVSIVRPSRPSIAWLGDTDGVELTLARRWAGELAAVSEPREDPAPDAVGPGPTAVVIAARRPGCWDLRRATAVVRRWPLAPLISLATSLDDGRRRSGPALPGVEEITWTDLPGRLAWWFAERAAGRPGSLGLPATVRREDRLLDAAARIGSSATECCAGMRIATAAARRADLEGLADLIAAIGRQSPVMECGRPSLEVAADVVVWDIGTTSPGDLTWLGMLTAHRPGLPVVVVESFPRGDTVLAAFRAGAAAVLGRPLSLEALAGTLLRLHAKKTAVPAAGMGGGTGIGAPARDG